MLLPCNKWGAQEVESEGNAQCRFLKHSSQRRVKPGSLLIRVFAFIWTDTFHLLQMKAAAQQGQHSPMPKHAHTSRAWPGHQLSWGMLQAKLSPLQGHNSQGRAPLQLSHRALARLRPQQAGGTFVAFTNYFYLKTHPGGSQLRVAHLTCQEIRHQATGNTPNVHNSRSRQTSLHGDKTIGVD